MLPRQLAGARRVVVGATAMLATTAAVLFAASPAHAAISSCFVPKTGGCGTGSINPSSAGTIWLQTTNASGGGSVTCRLYTAGGIEKGSLTVSSLGVSENPINRLSGRHFAVGVGSGADGICRIHN